MYVRIGSRFCISAAEVHGDRDLQDENTDIPISGPSNAPREAPLG